MHLLCPSCHEEIDVPAVATRGRVQRLSCPQCAANFIHVVGREEGGEGSAAKPTNDTTALHRAEQAEMTMFYPGSAIGLSIDEEEEEPPTLSTPAPATPPAAAPAPPPLPEEQPELEPGDQTTSIGARTAIPPPALPAGVEAWLLVVGAEPGEERLPLPAAKVVIGRRDADINIEGSGISEHHAQIEVVGREFYIRDLGSRNGTILNGRRVRYSELRPGDEIGIGFATLVFRSSGDGISRDELRDEEPSDATPLP